MIVDSHGHYGGCYIFDHHVDEQELIETDYELLSEEEMEALFLSNKEDM